MAWTSYGRADVSEWMSPRATFDIHLRPFSRGWRIPINIMIDLAHLRHSHSAVTVSEYLQLHGIPESVESTNGHFDKTEYLNTTAIPPPTLYIIPNNKYDNGPYGDSIRVDKLLPPVGESFKPTKVTDTLLHHLKSTQRHIAKLNDVGRVLEQAGMKTWNSDEELERILEEEGWAILYSF